MNNLIPVWIQLLIPAIAFCVFFFFYFAFLVGSVYCSRDPLASFFQQTFIKNESHDTIYTFKNCSATVFSIFSKITTIFAKKDLKIVVLHNKDFFFFFWEGLHNKDEWIT